jgi:hypothetical protein
LVALAKEYVAVAAQLAEVRDQIRRCVLNGADHEPANPTRPPVKVGGKTKARPAKSRSRAETMEASAALDATVMTLIKDKAMKSSDIARAAKARLSSTSARLHRLHAKGLIARGDGGAWSVAS